MNRHEPAFPKHWQDQTAGLTKLEYAALHIYANNKTITTRAAVAAANDLFDELEGQTKP